MRAPTGLITDPDIILGYLSDASNTRGEAAGLLVPRGADEVAEAVAWAQGEGLPITVTARRTGTTGAAVPHGGLLLSTERLSQVHAADDVDGGVVLGAHQDWLEARGLHFPPDPTSRHECSLGGAIVCNASGARSFRYGPTRRWIRWVDVVLPDGQLLERVDRHRPLPAGWPSPSWAEPPVKTAAGYAGAPNLLDLLIGSEGTLGVITRAGLELRPAPVGVLSLLAFFPDLGSMLGFVEQARAGAERARGPGGPPGPLNPRAIEYYDEHALEMVRARVPDVPAEATDALFIEIEHEGEPPLELWWAALVEAGALADHTIVAEDERGRRRLEAVRHAVPAGTNERVVANGMPKIGTDFAVPDAALGEMMQAYRAVQLPRLCFGHIGDNHLHLNLLPRSAEELHEARRVYRELAERAVALGGTVSAEHGIGKLKRALLAHQLGPAAIEQMRALKRAADPGWIMGRGTLFDAAASTPV